jgi:hypothetical protein
MTSRIRDPRPVAVTGRDPDASLRPGPGAHLDWCARGHHCTLGEHRAHPIRIDVPRVGSLVITRVQGATGHQYAEVRASLRLTPSEAHARHQIGTVLDGLTRLMWTARRAA